MDQLIAGSGRISWSSEALRTIYKFCARHQVSYHNLPSPEQFKELLEELKAPFNDPDAFADAVRRTTTALRSRVTDCKAMVALKETSGDRGQWICEWYVWSERWLKSDWDGDISLPADVTAAELLIRPVISKRHDLGATRLIRAVADLKREELLKQKGTNTRKEISTGDLQQGAATLAAAEASVQTPEKKTVESSQKSLDTMMQANNRILQLEQQVHQMSTGQTSQSLELNIARSQVEHLEQQVQQVSTQCTSQSYELNAAKTRVRQLERELTSSKASSAQLSLRDQQEIISLRHQVKQLSAPKSQPEKDSPARFHEVQTREANQLQIQAEKLKEAQDHAASESHALMLTKRRVAELEASLDEYKQKLAASIESYQAPVSLGQSVRKHFTSTMPKINIPRFSFGPDDLATFQRTPEVVQVTNMGMITPPHQPDFNSFARPSGLKAAAGIDDYPLSCYSYSPSAAAQSEVGSEETDALDCI